MTLLWRNSCRRLRLRLMAITSIEIRDRLLYVETERVHSWPSSAADSRSIVRSTCLLVGLGASVPSRHSIRSQPIQSRLAHGDTGPRTPLPLHWTLIETMTVCHLLRQLVLWHRRRVIIYGLIYVDGNEKVCIGRTVFRQHIACVINLWLANGG